VKANDAWRRDILHRLRYSGPLTSRDLPDHCAVPWKSTGWTNNRNVTQVLEGNNPRFPWKPSTTMLTYRLTGTTEASASDRGEHDKSPPGSATTDQHQPPTNLRAPRCADRRSDADLELYPYQGVVVDRW
jgi:hypothetical protein